MKEVETSDLAQMREEMDKLQAKVCYLTKSHMEATPSVILPVVQISLLRTPRYFNFFTQDNKEVPIVGEKRGHMGDLQNPDMPYD